MTRRKELDIEFDLTSVGGLTDSLIQHSQSKRRKFVSSWYVCHALLIVMTIITFMVMYYILEERPFDGYWDHSSSYYSSNISGHRMPRDTLPMILVTLWLLGNLIGIGFVGLTYLKTRNTPSNLHILFALCVCYSNTCFFLGLLFTFKTVRSVSEWVYIEKQTAIEKWGQSNQNLIAVNKIFGLLCFIYSAVYAWLAFTGYLKELSLLSVDPENALNDNSNELRSAMPPTCSRSKSPLRSNLSRSGAESPLCSNLSRSGSVSQKKKSFRQV